MNSTIVKRGKKGEAHSAKFEYLENGKSLLGKIKTFHIIFWEVSLDEIYTNRRGKLQMKITCFTLVTYCDDH